MSRFRGFSGARMTYSETPLRSKVVDKGCTDYVGREKLTLNYFITISAFIIMNNK
jgi:hypothetical protein